MNMRYLTGTDSGKVSLQTEISPDCGVVNLCPELPAGILEDAVAELTWTMAEDEKLFMNGYQTWTHSPEMGKRDRMRGVDQVPGPIRKHFGLDRYGDYHFVPYSGKKAKAMAFPIAISARAIPTALSVLWMRRRATPFLPMTVPRKS